MAHPFPRFLSRNRRFRNWNITVHRVDGGQMRKGERMWVCILLNLFHESSFLAELWLQCQPSLLLGLQFCHFSFQAGAISHFPTCHLADSAHNSASFCLCLSLPNLYPESNDPYKVSPVDQAPAAKSCFLLTFILKARACCQVPGHGTAASSFIAAKLWVTMADFCIILAVHIKLVHPNRPRGKEKGPRW